MIYMIFRYVQSVDYPAAAPAGMCMYDLNKCDSNICQFRSTIVVTLLVVVRELN